MVLLFNVSRMYRVSGCTLSIAQKYSQTINRANLYSTSFPIERAACFPPPPRFRPNCNAARARVRRAGIAAPASTLRDHLPPPLAPLCGDTARIIAPLTSWLWRQFSSSALDTIVLMWSFTLRDHLPLLYEDPHASLLRIVLRTLYLSWLRRLSLVAKQYWILLFWPAPPLAMLCGDTLMHHCSA